MASNRYVKLDIPIVGGIFIGKADRRFQIDKTDGIGMGMSHKVSGSSEESVGKNV